MKNITFREVKKLISCILFFLLSYHLSAQNQNFSGNWKLNKEKTNFGDYSENSAPVQLDVRQTKDSINISRTSVGKENDLSSYTEIMPFNERLVTNVIRNATRKTASIKWSSDNNSIIETGKYIDYSTKSIYSVTEKWDLIDDGKTLVVSRTDISDDGTFSAKFIYEKS